MFGLMRKLISKPFADTPEKRDQMDELVCDMVEGIPMHPTETIYLDSVTGPKTIKGKISFGDYPPIDYGDWHPRNGVDGSTIVKAAKPVWRPHNGRDLPTDAVKVFNFGKVAQVVGVYQGWHSVKYSEGGSVFDSQDSRVEFVFCGEYARRVKCPICTDGMLISRSTKSSIDSGSIDDGWVHTFEGMCPHCKGKGYTLERFKR